MRRIYTILFIISLTISGAQAQSPANNPWGVGILGGINRSASFYSSFRPQLQPAFAVDVSYSLNQRSSFRVQPSWSSLRYQPDNTYSGWGFYSTLNVSTIKIPVLYRYSFAGNQVTPSGNRLTPFLEVGAAYNRATSGDYTVSIPCDFCVPSPPDTDYRIRYSLTNKSAVSLVGSVGINVALKSVSIPILLRYERYLTRQIFATENSPDVNAIRFDNIALMAGVNF